MRPSNEAKSFYQAFVGLMMNRPSFEETLGSLCIGNFSCRASIISSMRRSLSFMLVMLLVLRGLLGNAMAMDMTSVALPIAPSQHPISMTAESDIDSHAQSHVAAIEPEHAIASAAACPADETASAHDCGHASDPSCSACGICHSAFFNLNPMADFLLPKSLVQPSLGSTQFASACAALDIKPPIS